ncbi:MAG: DUF47 family protein [Thaumarchaeota archaeon]|nr:DUF47 family protein [Nitrososphaerota archaeon]
MADSIVRLSDSMLKLVLSLPDVTERGIQQGLDEIKRIEEDIDSAFEESATKIMDLEIFPVNPDYFLDVARQLDKISDLMERTSLLLEGRRSLSNEESELLESAASQVQTIAQNISACMSDLGKNSASVRQSCETIAEREKAVDQINLHYNRISAKEGYKMEKRIWLKEVLGNLDMIADVARDLTISFRVISNKLEKQGRLDVKKGMLT